MIDDRTNLTIGKRLMEAKKFGYPFIIVIGGKTAECGKFELHQLDQEERMMELDFEEILHFIKIHTQLYNVY